MDVWLDKVEGVDIWRPSVPKAVWFEIKRLSG